MTLRKSQVNVIDGLSLEVKLLTIHQFANLCRTTPRTLRFYEKSGLFKPAKIDRFNGYRYYNLRQARDFLKIKLLKRFDLPLSKIQQHLKENKGKVSLNERLKAIKQEIEEKQLEHNFLKEIDLLFSDQKYFDKNLKKESFGPFTLLCVHIENGEYEKITTYIKDLWKTAEGLKLKCIPSEITFYIDYIYQPKEIKIEIAIILEDDTIPKNLVLPPNHYFKKYPKTKVLVYNYKGLYDFLPIFYQKFYDYLDQKGFSPKQKNKVFERYIKGPLNSKSKYHYSTKIGVPIS